MYFAIYGKFSNGESKYAVTECLIPHTGELVGLSDFIKYTNHHDCELVSYELVNGMPEELHNKYSPYGDYTFVDGILMEVPKSNDDEYKIVGYHR